MADRLLPTVFDLTFVEAVCGVLAQTGPPGLTGSELQSALRPSQLDGIFVLAQGPNKRTRLLNTLHTAQTHVRNGGPVVGFIHDAMHPTRYVKTPERFEALRSQLNTVLAFSGLHVDERGKLATGAIASTLPEAAQLSGELVSELRRRGCHDAVLRYCSEELVHKSLFHAMGEASKSIPDRVRRHTRLTADGAELYDQAFGSKTLEPVCRINDLADDSDRSEHRGFKNLLLGIHGHYRNPRAHRTRLGSAEMREDFFDAFALFSYVHRRLDRGGFAP